MFKDVCYQPVGVLFLFDPNFCSLPSHLNTIKYIFIHDKSSNFIPSNNIRKLAPPSEQNASPRHILPGKNIPPYNDLLSKPDV